MFILPLMMENNQRVLAVSREACLTLRDGNRWSIYLMQKYVYGQREKKEE